MEAVDFEIKTSMTRLVSSDTRFIAFHQLHIQGDKGKRAARREKRRGGDGSWNEERFCTDPFCCDDAPSHKNM